MRRIKEIKGQIIPLFALVMIVLAMFSFMVWNIGMLELDRQRMQTAADAAALSAMRCKAAFLNKIAIMNDSVRAFVPIIIHNERFGVTDQKLIPPYKTLMKTMSGFYRGLGGAPYLTGYKAAQLNGADGSFGLFVKGGSGTGLVPRKLTVYAGHWIIVGGIPVPIPPYGQYTFDAGYYCRTWEKSKREAQPQQEMAWVAFKNSKTFAHSLYGIKEKVRVQAVAQARLYLNVSENAFFHNGGFPRDESEGACGWGVEPVSFWPNFDARLVPVEGGFYH